jgi:hypothetical protein
MVYGPMLGFCAVLVGGGGDNAGGSDGEDGLAGMRALGPQPMERRRAPVRKEYSSVGFLVPEPLAPRSRIWHLEAAWQQVYMMHT